MLVHIKSLSLKQSTNLSLQILAVLALESTAGAYSVIRLSWKEKSHKLLYFMKADKS